MPAARSLWLAVGFLVCTSLCSLHDIGPHSCVRLDDAVKLCGSRGGKLRAHTSQRFTGTGLPHGLHESSIPDITFSVKLGSTEDIVASLLSYQSDIGITFNMPPQDGIEVLKKFEYPLHALVAPCHELARRRKTSLHEVSKYRLVMPESTFGVRQIVNLAMREYGIDIDMFMTTNSLAFARSMARRGAVVTLSSKFAARG